MIVIHNGANPDYGGGYAVAVAVSSHNLEIVKYLVDNGAPLRNFPYVAVLHKDFEIFKYLVEKGLEKGIEYDIEIFLLKILIDDIPEVNKMTPSEINENKIKIIEYMKEIFGYIHEPAF